jgi:hypothetical protein
MDFYMVSEHGFLDDVGSSLPLYTCLDNSATREGAS